MKVFDVIVIGAGPAGSTCATLCAEAGNRVLLLEASRFPRDKVCGDCLNPAAWPVLERLSVAERVRSLPSTSPEKIRFSVAGAGLTEITIPECKSKSTTSELVVRRRDLDELLVSRAVEAGVVFQDGSPVTGLRQSVGLSGRAGAGHWEVTTSTGDYHLGKRIVAADGRNSVTARHLGMHTSRRRKGRIGLQIHIPYPTGYDRALEMRIYRHGYGGLADLGNGLANLCLVANDGEMKELRKEAEIHYGLTSACAWRSITPISRASACHVAREGVFLCGDAARVVEPFTGEGISFALRSGALLANILNSGKSDSTMFLASQEKLYRQAHRDLYRSGLFVNRLTCLLSEHPKIAHALSPFLLKHPKLLSFLTSKVISI